MQTAIIAQRFENRRTDKIYELVKTLARPAARLLHNFTVTANEVTIARMFGAPISFYLLYSFFSSVWAYIAIALFWAYSDAVDGVMSKQFEHKPDTDIGVLLDPFSDKILIASMYGYHYVNFPHIVVITVICETILASLSLGSVIFTAVIGQDYREVIRKMKATKWGKYKLNLEVASAILMISYFPWPSQGLALAVFLTASTAIFLLIMSALVKVKKLFV